MCISLLTYLLFVINLLLVMFVIALVITGDADIVVLVPEKASWLILINLQNYF